LLIDAVTLLKELQAHTGPGKYLFPALGNSEKCINENTLNHALRRMGYCTRTQMTAHGLVDGLHIAQ
jgi:hypothetical protein